MKRLVVLGFVLVLISPVSARAQVGLRGFASVSFGVQTPSTKGFTQQAAAEFRFEEATFETTYDQGAGGVFDLHGGVLWGGRVGVAVGVTRFNKDGAGNSRVALPHPFFFEQHASAVAASAPLSHTERAFHVNVVYAPVTAGALQVTVFGGPARLSVTQQLVKDFDIEETLFDNLDYEIAIADSLYETDSATAWGFNAGVDGTYMLTRSVGVGGMLRVLRATVELKDALRSSLELTDIRGDYKAGGVVGAFGVRVMWGR